MHLSVKSYLQADARPLFFVGQACVFMSSKMWKYPFIRLTAFRIDSHLGSSHLVQFGSCLEHKASDCRLAGIVCTQRVYIYILQRFGQNVYCKPCSPIVGVLITEAKAAKVFLMTGFKLQRIVHVSMYWSRSAGCPPPPECCGDFTATFSVCPCQKRSNMSRQNFTWDKILQYGIECGKDCCWCANW